MDTPVTEFEDIDVDEVHLVKRGANGFPPLLAKADALCSDGCEVCTVEKGTLNAKQRHKMDDSDFAYVDAKGGRHLPIHDEAHVRAALGRFSQTQFDSAADKAAAARRILAAAKKFGITVSDDTAVSEAAKSADFGVPVVTGVNADPGSSAWEQADAECLSQAAQALTQVCEKVRHFIGREQQEAAAGQDECGDICDAQDALSLVSAALGIVARLSYTEGAGKAEKAGRVLSAKNVAGLKAAVKAIQDVLATAGEATKSEEDIVTKDELFAALDERDEARRAAKKATRQAERDAAKAKRDEKRAAAKAAREAAKAAKAEQRKQETPEEREARKAAKAERATAKAEAKAARKAGKAQAAAKAVGDEVREVVTGIASQLAQVADRLSTVEKMAAPGGPVKTRQPADLTKSAERDRLEMEITRLDNRAREMAGDPETQRGYAERINALRKQLDALS